MSNQCMKEEDHDWVRTSHFFETCSKCHYDRYSREWLKEKEENHRPRPRVAVEGDI